MHAYSCKSYQGFKESDPFHFEDFFSQPQKSSEKTHECYPPARLVADSIHFQRSKKKNILPQWGRMFFGFYLPPVEVGILSIISLTGVFLFKKTTQKSIKNWMGPYQRTPKEVARAIRFSGLGVRSAGPVGDFLEKTYELHGSRWVCPKISGFYPNEIRNWGDGMFGTIKPTIKTQATTLRLRVILFQNKSNKLTQYKKNSQKKTAKNERNLQKSEKNIENLRSLQKSPSWMLRKIHLKFNIAPENRPLEKETPIGNHHL